MAGLALDIRHSDRGLAGSDVWCVVGRRRSSASRDLG